METLLFLNMILILVAIGLIIFKQSMPPNTDRLELELMNRFFNKIIEFLKLKEENENIKKRLIDLELEIDIIKMKERKEVFKKTVEDSNQSVIKDDNGDYTIDIK
ncbi:hypothetical protein [Ornithobacterium rhinotracheale]